MAGRTNKHKGTKVTKSIESYYQCDGKLERELSSVEYEDLFTPFTI